MTYSLNLQSWLPKELHPEINNLLVAFGQVSWSVFLQRAGSS